MAKPKFIDLNAEFKIAKERVDFLHFAKERIDAAEELCKKQKQKLERLLFIKVLCLENGKDIEELQETQLWLNEFITDQAYRKF
jgi:hypothetical protein